jgi:hypothetical protein
MLHLRLLEREMSLPVREFVLAVTNLPDFQSSCVTFGAACHRRRACLDM